MARILVIEDDKDNRQIIREILKAQDHEVMEAEDGHMGLSLQEEHGFDLVLTDILMPVMEGIETVRELTRQYPGLRIIAMSAFRQGYLDAARKFGAMETLEKPFTPNEVVACVERCLSRTPPG